MRRRTLDADRFLGVVEKMDRRLVDAGFPPMSAFWRATFERFFRSGRRQLVLRVGRRGGKSTMLCRLAVAWALFGSWAIPPGDAATIAFVSVNRDEASQRLRTIGAILAALGKKYVRSGDTIELEGRPAVFRVLTASVAGVSGWTCIALFGDELALWRASDSDANPAREVIGQLRPTVATQPFAPIILSSSARTHDDYHAELCAAGDNDFQSVAIATTWEANPSLTKEQCRALEPNERHFLMQYASVPQDSTASCLSIEEVERAMRPMPVADYGPCIFVVDASSGKNDSYTSCGVRWAYPALGEPIDYTFVTTTGVENSRSLFEHDERGKFKRDADGKAIPKPGVQLLTRPQLVFFDVEAVEGQFFGSIMNDDIARGIAQRAKRWGARALVSDQHDVPTLARAADNARVRFLHYPWNAQNKPMAVMRMQRLFAQTQIVIPEKDEKFKRELLGFTEKVMKSGSVTYEARRRGHDDRVALIITALIAEQNNELPWSPIREPGGKLIGAPEEYLG